MRCTIFIASLALLAGACGDDVEGNPSEDATVGTDATVDPPDATPDAPAGDAEPTSGCSDRIPNGPFGVALGRNIEDFTLERCDGGNFSFYEDSYCEASMTVVSVAAGWCGPCQIESAQLTEQITRRYAADGVRVLQILRADPQFAAPTIAYCQEWINTYNLENIQVIDPVQITSTLFPDDALPGTIIVDNEGVVRHQEVGVSEGLITLRNAIEAELARQQNEM